MATGRTHPRWVRAYIDGYDMSGYSRSVGLLGWNFVEADLTVTMSDAVKGYLPGQANISFAALNGVFDNTVTSGLHVIASSIQSERVVMIPIGIRAAPAVGDPVFCGQFVQLGYNALEEGNAVVANIPFGPWESANLIDFSKPWGNMLLAKVAKTAANSSGTGVDQTGGLTTWGGFMCYQVFTASAAGHTATIKVQHSTEEVDGSYADLGGCTTGVIDVGTAPVSDIVATTATTTTVNQFLRWQVTLGTATSVTLALAFMRGNKEQ